MKLKFATFELRWEPRISFSREEILSMKNSISQEDQYIDASALLQFLDALEQELLNA